jgi:hypothetical protein
MPTASEDERESSLDEIKWIKEDDFIHEVEQKKESIESKAIKEAEQIN